MKYKPLILLMFLLILSSFASAETFQLNESRARISFDPAGDNDEITYTGFEDVFVGKGGDFSIYRLRNNFTQITLQASGAGANANFFSWLNNNTVLNESTTYPSTIFTFVGTSVIAIEIDINGINDINTVNSFDLNTVTPIPYLLSGFDGATYDESVNFLYVLHNDSKTINVYDVSKPALYDYSWVRSFILPNDCGYTHASRQDISILHNQLYLLCGDKGQTPDRTAYTFSLLGDARDTLTFNTLDNQYHSLTFNEDASEIILYDDDAKEIVFFGFDENLLYSEEVIIANGIAYNTSNLCMPNNQQLCSNTSISVNQYGNVIFTCENQDLTWCSNTCNNIEDSFGVLNGNCLQNACTNECDNPYAPFNEVCETPNTYSRCTEGGDGCLDLDSGFFCPLDFSCVISPSGDGCVFTPQEESGLYTTPFISIDLDVNYSNAYEVIGQDVDSVVNVVTTPTSTVFGIGVQAIQGFFLKTFANSLLQNVQITGVEELNITEYSALSCDFRSSILEEDYMESLNDFSTTNIITTDNTTSWIDINTNSTKTFETSSLGQRIEYIVEPLGSGTNYIRFMDGVYSVLELEISYDNTTNNILIRDTGFNKLLVNETAIAGTDSLSYITFKHLFIADADINNIEIGVFREVNNIETQQFYYSKPISYYSNNAVAPKTMSFYNTDNSTLRLYQIIQIEEDGYAPYVQGDSGTCEFLSLQCFGQRAWVNSQAQQTYYFYEDIQTCVNELEGVSTGNIGDLPSIDDGELDFFEQILNRNLTQDEKLLFGSVIISLIFGIFVYGYIETRESFILVGGVILSGLFMLWFTVIGYIPAWIIFLLILVGGGVAVTFRSRG